MSKWEINHTIHEWNSCSSSFWSWFRKGCLGSQKAEEKAQTSHCPLKMSWINSQLLLHSSSTVNISSSSACCNEEIVCKVTSWKNSITWIIFRWGDFSMCVWHVYLLCIWLKMMPLYALPCQQRKIQNEIKIWNHLKGCGNIVIPLTDYSVIISSIVSNVVII